MLEAPVSVLSQTTKQQAIQATWNASWSLISRNWRTTLFATQDLYPSMCHWQNFQ
jgi:hypothetical protein